MDLAALRRSDSELLPFLLTTTSVSPLKPTLSTTRDLRNKAHVPRTLGRNAPFYRSPWRLNVERAKSAVSPALEGYEIGVPMGTTNAPFYRSRKDLALVQPNGLVSSLSEAGEQDVGELMNLAWNDVAISLRLSSESPSSRSIPVPSACQVPTPPEYSGLQVSARPTPTLKYGV
ncbi:hypothetical protein ONZ45_g3686 [Pleurotus djamor]|nr:hypothetical protein ONZ45_g3686 [Pleurotus djamor]